MPYVKGKRYPYTDAGKKAAYEAAKNANAPITDVMNERPIKSKLKPYKLNRGI